MNREFSIVESNAEFGENFRVKTVSYDVYRMECQGDFVPSNLELTS